MANILDPIRIAGMSLPHRYYFAPAGTCIATKDGEMTERAVANMEAISRGMCGGLVTWALFYIHRMGRSFSSIFSIEHDDYIRGIGMAVERIHLTGAKVTPMLFHGGALARGWTTGAGYAVSSSDMKSFFDPNEEVKGLTEKEIADVIRQFGEAARRTKKCEFDAVYLHACHGSLIQQFHSPRMNGRKDAWGKDPTLFGRKVVEEIKNVVGANFPLIVRISVDEFMPGDTGYDVTYGVNELVPAYVAAGADAICVSAGRIGLSSGERTIPSIYRPYGVNLDLAAKVKEKLRQMGKPDLPVLHAGKFFDHKLCEKVIADNVIDMAGLCRPIIADADAVRKRIQKKFDEERKCICCNYCTTTVAFQDYTASKCAVNSQYCREIENSDRPANEIKNVMIIGGGPAGMEAARILSKRGHRVSLFEKESALGGLVECASSIPKLNTSSLRNIKKYLVRQMERCDVDVRLNTTVDRAMIEESIESGTFDTVIIATGSRMIVPEIKGIDRKNVITYEAYLKNPATCVGRTVAVLGAQEGAEIAASLGREGRTVHLIDSNNVIAETPYLHDPFRKSVLFEFIEGKNIVKHLETDVLEITATGVVVFDRLRKAREEIPVDNVIVSSERTSCNELYESLRLRHPEIYLIGDARRPTHIGEAIHSAGWVAREI